MRITIPDNPEQIDVEIDELGRSHVVTGWGLAARIWTRCEPRAAGRPKKLRDSAQFPKLSFREYARKGLYGLTSDNHVGHHWHAWQDAIEAGWVTPVTVGDDLDFPLLETKKYPPDTHGNGVRDLVTKQATTEDRLKVIHHLQDEDAEIDKLMLDEFVQRIGKDPLLLARVERVYEEHFPKPEPRPKPIHRLGFLVLAQEIGDHVYAGIIRQQQPMTDLLHYLRDHPHLTTDEDASVTTMLERMESSRNQLNLWEDATRTARGMDRDDTFRRLVSEGTINESPEPPERPA